MLVLIRRHIGAQLIRASLALCLDPIFDARRHRRPVGDFARVLQGRGQAVGAAARRHMVHGGDEQDGGNERGKHGEKGWVRVGINWSVPVIKRCLTKEDGGCLYISFRVVSSFLTAAMS